MKNFHSVIYSLCLLVLLPAYPLLAQTASETQTKKEVLTNETIIELNDMKISRTL